MPFTRSLLLDDELAAYNFSMDGFDQEPTKHVADEFVTNDHCFSLCQNSDSSGISMNHNQCLGSQASLSPPSSMSDTSLDDSNSSHCSNAELLVNQNRPWSPTTALDVSASFPQQFGPRMSLPASVNPCFKLHSSSLYPPPNMVSPMAPESSKSSPQGPVIRGVKHSREPSFALDFQSSKASTPDVHEGVVAKRPRVERTASSVRAAGACTRCKRLKMKCTFPDDSGVCNRCSVGGHECVVLGRKPRSPGLREILRKQIREKDAMIDTLLNQMNPVPSMATPVTIVPSRMALTPSQRFLYRDVLAYFEKSQSLARNPGDARAKIDVSSLEYGSDEEYSDEDEDAQSTLDFHVLPKSSAPAGLLATAALASSHRASSPASRTDQSPEKEDPEDPAIEGGVGSKTYFHAGPSANLDLRRLIIERQAAPDILLSGLVTFEDVMKLFQIYWKRINPFIPVLDENIHTPAAVLGRCPFLFTVVCAVSSRYYEEKPEMYDMAMHLAKAAAANAFLDGWKTVEMCQAYVLMGTYTPPARRWEEDRVWFHTGVAFRLAIDLNLNRIPTTKPIDERGERELLNRIRAWIICYIVDRCICVNLGKPFMIPEDEIIRNAARTFLGHRHQHRGDEYLVSLVELLRIMTRFAEMSNSSREAKPTPKDNADLIAFHKVFEEDLNSWKNTSAERCAEQTASDDPDDAMQMALMQSVFHYCRLVTFSAGLQQVTKRGTLADDDIFFMGCLHSASAVINCMLEGLIPTGFIPYCPEQVLALSAFATAVLVKCLKPAVPGKMDQLQEDRIVELLQRLVKGLASDPLALDEKHTPIRYARLLEHLTDPAIAGLEERRAGQSTAKSEDSPPADATELPASSSSASGSSSLPAPAPTAVPGIPEEPVSQGPAYPVVFEDSLVSPGCTGPDDMTVSMSLFSSSWDDGLYSYHDSEGQTAPVPSLMGSSDSEYLAAMMAFPDQMWSL